MHTDPATDPAQSLREHGLRVTKQRVSVMSALAAAPHSGADAVIGAVRADVGQVSTQAVYDVLNTLTGARPRPAHPARRLVGPLRAARRRQPPPPRLPRLRRRGGRRLRDRDGPCLDPSDLDRHAPGFVVDEAEVTFWGLCDTCSGRSAGS